jgi:hypothetical protein
MECENLDNIINLPQRKEKRKLVSEAEKAEILKRVKERDFSIKSFTNTEFAEMVHQVRFLNKENKTFQQCKPLTLQNIKSNNHNTS